MSNFAPAFCVKCAFLYNNYNQNIITKHEKKTTFISALRFIWYVAGKSLHYVRLDDSWLDAGK